MANFFGILGLMTFVYIVFELLCVLTRRLDSVETQSFGFSILIKFLALIMYILMIGSSPIGILVFWRDQRIEKIHKQHFLDEQRPYVEAMKHKESMLTSEIATLKEYIRNEHGHYQGSQVTKGKDK